MVIFPTITVLADAFFYDMRMNKAVRWKAAAMMLDRMFKTVDAKRPSALANTYYCTYLQALYFYHFCQRFWRIQEHDFGSCRTGKP